MLDAALLGTGGMMPMPNRFLASFALRLDGKLLLIDCGEGTQVSHRILGWGFKNIDVICITHFHADHISGLAGLILTIANSNREDALTIIGPPGLCDVASSLLVIVPELPFEIIFKELEFTPGVTQNIKAAGFDISAFPLKHRMACFAYSAELSRPGRFDAERAKELEIPLKYWNVLQKGQDVKYEGKTFTPSMVLGTQRRGLKISYCTDTRPVDGLADFVRHSDLFVCEGLYGDNEKLEKAASHRHMIYSEAAKIAKDAEVSELWLTHFSPAMLNPSEFLKNARNIFPNSHAGSDRKNKTFKFIDE
ncbi:MAG: ribonuclease Z [Clostridiales bacterium]|jgi:ribonuclease Z|nr:ribonuclease Z [Clostridiales bacterium]